MSKCEVLQNYYKIEVTNSKGLVIIVRNDLDYPLSILLPSPINLPVKPTGVVQCMFV